MNDEEGKAGERNKGRRKKGLEEQERKEGMRKEVIYLEIVGRYVRLKIHAERHKTLHFTLF